MSRWLDLARVLQGEKGFCGISPEDVPAKPPADSFTDPDENGPNGGFAGFAGENSVPTSTPVHASRIRIPFSEINQFPNIYARDGSDTGTGDHTDVDTNVHDHPAKPAKPSQIAAKEPKVRTCQVCGEGIAINRPTSTVCSPDCALESPNLDPIPGWRELLDRA